MGGHGMAPVAKAKNFGESARRLLAELKPQSARIVVVMVLAAISGSFAVVGPKIPGKGRTIVFNGGIGKQFPAA